MKDFPARLNRKRRSCAIRVRPTRYDFNPESPENPTVTTIGGDDKGKFSGVVVCIANNYRANRAFRAFIARYELTVATNQDTGHYVPVDAQRNAFEVWGLAFPLSLLEKAQFVVRCEARANDAVPRGAAGAGSQEDADRAKCRQTTAKRAIVRVIFRKELAEGEKRAEGFYKLVANGTPGIAAYHAIKG